ncbi:hypothetical protein ASPZODRAFT_20870 [Penicilliopsis zonata CBS 506.65]|uniref:DUF614 domain protein n=1 Tax=Penicilliopsis zonata CBS 506.65 TaxID=1073090 RepID=A0A1L9S4C4_9EURO|nr:hypothetical protein ASPZODRAFT_20870 [Penicilliopsis zonata CBS 506.65]OJJ42015.1 hypothetical protein ASPZODRAFT_20870 [Penicilliopsis zonata CBS 506.65]
MSYSPGGDQGPPLDGLPPASFGPEWSSSFWQFWSPGKTCLVGFICPAYLFSRTQARNKDPTLSNFRSCNHMCMAWHALTCLGGGSAILHAVKRRDMRDQYGIQGNSARDWLATCFCRPCALIQEEKESLLRAQSTVGYERPQGMQYP